MPLAFPISNGMSIITEALKKAEHERELKVKQAPPSQLVNQLLLEEEKTVESFLEHAKATEEMISLPVQEEVAHEHVVRFELSASTKIFLLASLIVLVCFAFLLLPFWSLSGRNWRSFVHKKTFQAASIGVIYDYDQGMIKTARSHGKPFRASEGSRALPYSLSGISIVGQEGYAVVNGRIVQKGDSIDGAFVKEISQGEVVLETRSGEIKLILRS